MDANAGSADADEGTTRLVSPGELTELAEAALRNMGAPRGVALAVAASLVDSNLVGHDSHGVRRLPIYARAVDRGRIEPDAVPEVEPADGAVLTVRGHRAFGQVAAATAVRALNDVVAGQGIGIAAVRDCNHIGRLGEYVESVAESGYIGIALCNVDPTVAPFGGRERRLGTNPLAWALPCGPADDPAGDAPVVMDWATSAVAEGKLAMARARGEHAPDGVLMDSAGRVSTQPADFYRGGALLPFAGHKGYGLSVMIEVVGGLLSGGGISCLPGYSGDNGTVLIGIDPARFMTADAFRTQVEDFCAELRSTPAAEGADEVLVPGDVERRARAERAENGIPVPSSVWEGLTALVADRSAEQQTDDPGAGGGRAADPAADSAARSTR
ncbi:Ldh family oxidoreductase [Streptomonospora wellingtoniae]|uniref:Ldh family oxidoreductase n=1 Tax=Streptomonospora wellingtoniae TaxID=3075544 RepID=A0ABU2KNA9_9ACTN|nr:Ldh family oxidoreductase [Streptomonospora sp. DSM 45055]MDT0300754.1 Ldh family oxidoreductase [Streptomonospora sp. DSM 45055]